MGLRWFALREQLVVAPKVSAANESNRLNNRTAAVRADDPYFEFLVNKHDAVSKEVGRQPFECSAVQPLPQTDRNRWPRALHLPYWRMAEAPIRRQWSALHHGCTFATMCECKRFAVIRVDSGFV